MSENVSSTSNITFPPHINFNIKGGPSPLSRGQEEFNWELKNNTTSSEEADINNIVELPSGLTEHIEKAVDAISTIPDGSYSLAVISGITAAMSAFLFNHFNWKYIKKVNRLAHFSNICIKMLTNFEEASLSYWLTDKNNSNQKEMEKLEIHINSTFKMLSGNIDEFCSSLNKKHKSDEKKIKNIRSEIFDIATGGDFQSATRDNSKPVAIKITSLCCQAKSTLYKHSQIV
ncbi:hypothetical protein [Zobellella sp. An-6]|uniref:hypothetical protein n=1 Tax=Zobellella sp. An-6 TaxID=3400218 RepID=UPI0040435C02